MWRVGEQRGGCWGQCADELWGSAPWPVAAGARPPVLGSSRRFALAPIYDVAAGSIQERAQVVERAVDVDARDVDMPVLM